MNTKTLVPAALGFLLIAKLGLSTQQPADIRSVDFKNFSFPWDPGMQNPPQYNQQFPWRWLPFSPQGKIQVSGGIHHFFRASLSPSERARAPLLSMDGVEYGDLTSDGRDEAAVHLNYSSGGTQNWDYLFVYQFHSGQPQLMGVLKSGERGYSGLYRAAIRGGLLVLDFADPERRVGDCCSEGYIRVQYRWKTGRFIEEGARGRGDIDLNAH